MKKIHTENWCCKYVFVKRWTEKLESGKDQEMIEYWIIDKNKSLITGNYSFSRSYWIMFLNDRHKEIFRLT